jgi:putative tricarboxylic transport membrane protein
MKEGDYMEKERKQDIIVSVIVLGISILFYINTKPLTPPADIFPKVVILTFAVLGIILLLKSIFYKKYGEERTEEDSKEINNPKRRWISIVSLIVYTILIPIVGFYVTSALFVTLISIYLRGEKQGVLGYIRPLLISCLVMAVLYGAFDVFLKVPVPGGILL